jgi:hypothetical protein
LFQTSPLDWESWKINVKIGVEPLKGSPLGAKKHQKSVMQYSGINGKPDDFFPISVTPIKIENREDSVLTTFF